MVEVLAQRTFTVEDQTAFALLSGDANPMHMDALAARRTQAGKPVVHGVHTLLWAMDRVAARHPGLPRPGAVRADFRSFLHIGRTAKVSEREDASGRRLAVTADDVTILSLELGALSRRTPRAVQVPSVEPARPNLPVELQLGQIADQRGLVAFAAEPEAVAAAFPHASAWIGVDRVGALLCCTRLVGMACPGLHSIFNRLDVELEGVGGAPGLLSYAVEGVDPRFRRVALAVAASGLTGSLVTSVRTPPVRQVSMAVLAGRVEPGEFKGARALVVGGSRGLGEATAKVLASGGAEVVVTYARGRSDAEGVAAEIGDAGGRCTVTHFEALDDAAEQLQCVGSFTHAYYFATQSILTSSARTFDPERLEAFLAMYVSGFSRLCQALMAQGGTVGVYYPSSVSVADRPAGMGEYAMAKAAGEILCEEINRAQSRLHVIASRLPRLATDQTASLISVETPDPIDILHPLIQRVQQIGRPNVTS